MRILVVEDDARVASFIRRGLREEQYTVDVAGDGEQALFLAQTNDYDLLILDLVIPKRPGLEVLRTLRAERVSTPILILTAKGKPEEKVAGLDAGADDYLPKPFDFDELLARVRALLRRRGDLIPTVLRAGDLELDVLRHRATRASCELALTSREYAVLEFLLRYQNQLVTRTMLAEHVWEHDFDPLSNVINVTVARLRKKIDGDSSQKLLHTVRDRGYILRAPEGAKKAPRPSAR
jgi:DNA-binding response OmpR family regulator